MPRRCRHRLMGRTPRCCWRGRCARARASGLAASRQSLTAGSALEIDLHRGGGVLGDVAAVGDHHRDRLADIADLVARQGELRARRLDGRVGHQHRDRLLAMRAGRSSRGEHGVHAGHAPVPPMRRSRGSSRAHAGCARSRHAACPASSMSSTKRPRPVSSAGSSRRATRAPKCFAPMAGYPVNAHRRARDDTRLRRCIAIRVRARRHRRRSG